VAERRARRDCDHARHRHRGTGRGDRFGRDRPCRRPHLSWSPRRPNAVSASPACTPGRSSRSKRGDGSSDRAGPQLSMSSWKAERHCVLVEEPVRADVRFASNTHSRAGATGSPGRSPYLPAQGRGPGRRPPRSAASPLLGLPTVPTLACPASQPRSHELQRAVANCLTRGSSRHPGRGVRPRRTVGAATTRNSLAVVLADRSCTHLSRSAASKLTILLPSRSSGLRSGALSLGAVLAGRRRCR
jgi:hypothetical protein